MTDFSPSSHVRNFILQTGRNLKTARKRRQKTIKEVAEMVDAMVDASVSTIQRLEKGDTAVKFSSKKLTEKAYILSRDLTGMTPDVFRL